MGLLYCSVKALLVRFFWGRLVVHARALGKTSFSRLAATLPLTAESFHVGHPLEPLSADEIRQAAAACRAYADQNGIGSLRFNVISLQASCRDKQIVMCHFVDGALPGGFAPARA